MNKYMKKVITLFVVAIMMVGTVLAAPANCPNWAAEAYGWCYDNHVIGITTPTPTAEVTRGQTWDMLYGWANPNAMNSVGQLSGSPAKWVVDSGFSDGTRSRDGLTRAEGVTLLYRAVGSPATSGSTQFIDLGSVSWAKDAITWAVQNGITNGTDSTHFDPNGKLVAAAMETFIYRAAMNFDPVTTSSVTWESGCPEWGRTMNAWAHSHGIVWAGGPAWNAELTRYQAIRLIYGWTHDDFIPSVKSSILADDPVKWAQKAGVSDGTRIDDGLTRAEGITLLYRAAGCPAVSGSASSSFTDIGSVSWAQDAIEWGVENGITKGTDNTHFDPDASLTALTLEVMMFRAS